MLDKEDAGLSQEEDCTMAASIASVALPWA